MESIVSCKCGRRPVENQSLRGYRYSLSCLCGKDEVQYLTRSERRDVCIDNWNSLITEEPFQHSFQDIAHPDADVDVSPPRGNAYLDHHSDPLVRLVRAGGGFTSGAWPGPS